MNKNINKYIKIIKQNGETLNNRSINEDKGLKRVESSAYIKEKHLLIKGEYNKEKSRKRKAIIVWYDVLKRQVIGK
jgi:hypothetical protein